MTNQRIITMIPPTRNQHNAASLTKAEKRRVAAYARVSTDKEEQETSFFHQVEYYTSYINSREDWELYHVFTDDGISATTTAKRGGFKKMVDEALAGKFSLIVTKSVSRFARNTVDSLQTIRKLKEAGCEVYFEKENIWTFDGKGELLITIMSSIAQEESRSISENCTWGQRRRIAEGKITVPYSHFLGFEKGDEDGVLKVNEEEAVIVRKIYSLFLEGQAYHKIAKTLVAEGIPSPAGKEKWYTRTIKSILTNEKYRGDALLQKRFTVDFLTKKQKVNEGEIPRYYVKNAHPAIIAPEVFDIVQAEIIKRKSDNKYYSSANIFGSKVKCGQCDSWFGAKVWHSTSKYRRTIYQCNSKFKNGEKCNTPHFYEEDIKNAFVVAVNKLLADKNEIIANFKFIKTTLFDTKELEDKQLTLQYERAELSKLMEKCIEENARFALDQAEYNKRFTSLEEQYVRLDLQLSEISEQITNKKLRLSLFENFVSEIKKQKHLITEFDERLWYSLLDFMVVNNSEDIQFVFKDGTEITV